MGGFDACADMSKVPYEGVRSKGGKEREKGENGDRDSDREN